MTKSTYIQQRSQGIVDFGLAWEMYISVLQGKPTISPNVFQQLLLIYIEMYRGDMSGYFRYYDQLFGVNMLTKKDGNVLFY